MNRNVADLDPRARAIQRVVIPLEVALVERIRAAVEVAVNLTRARISSRNVVAQTRKLLPAGEALNHLPNMTTKRSSQLRKTRTGPRVNP
jgi:hypothetical protein